MSGLGGCRSMMLCDRVVGIGLYTVSGAGNGTRGGSRHGMNGNVSVVHSAVRVDCKQPCCKSVSKPVHAAAYMLCLGGCRWSRLYDHVR